MLENLNSENFFFYKQAGFFLAFTVGTLIQILSPHHANIKADFQNWRVNLTTAVMNAVVLTIVAGGLILKLSTWVVENRFGLLQIVGVPLIAQVASTVLILDFVAYAWHIANHRSQFLWRFHLAHHSDFNFDTSTAIRFHIGELIFSFFVRVLVVALFGLPVAGLLVFELIYQWANIFEHGNIRLSNKIEDILGRVFVTPAIHRKHHSQIPKELNSNYGTIFSFWDRIGKTFTPSHSSEHFVVGLPQQKQAWTFRDVMMKPFFRG